MYKSIKIMPKTAGICRFAAKRAQAPPAIYTEKPAALAADANKMKKDLQKQALFWSGYSYHK